MWILKWKCAFDTGKDYKCTCFFFLMQLTFLNIVRWEIIFKTHFALISSLDTLDTFLQWLHFRVYFLANSAFHHFGLFWHIPLFIVSLVYVHLVESLLYRIILMSCCTEPFIVLFSHCSRTIMIISMLYKTLSLYFIGRFVFYV
jgi:hypothetical protein